MRELLREVLLVLQRLSHSEAEESTACLKVIRDDLLPVVPLRRL